MLCSRSQPTSQKVVSYRSDRSHISVTMLPKGRARAARRPAAERRRCWCRSTARRGHRSGRREIAWRRPMPRPERRSCDRRPAAGTTARRAVVRCPRSASPARAAPRPHRPARRLSPPGPRPPTAWRGRDSAGSGRWWRSYRRCLSDPTGTACSSPGVPLKLNRPQLFGLRDMPERARFGARRDTVRSRRRYRRVVSFTVGRWLPGHGGLRRPTLPRPERPVHPRGLGPCCSSPPATAHRLDPGALPLCRARPRHRRVDLRRRGRRSALHRLRRHQRPDHRPTGGAPSQRRPLPRRAVPGMALPPVLHQLNPAHRRHAIIEVCSST